METDLQAIRDMVSKAELPAKVQQTVLTTFDQLPKVYQDLGRTYESRFSDRIVGLVEGMVRTLANKDACPDAPGLAENMVNRLRAMHDRHGIAVALKPPPQPARKPVRKAKAKAK